MNQAAQEKLRALRERLASLDPYPWSAVEAWIASSQPLIRAHYSDHVDDFNANTATPRWHYAVLVASEGDDWGGPPRNNFIEASTEEDRENRARASRAKQKILGFVDGLLDLPPRGAPPASSDTAVVNGDLVFGDKHVATISDSAVGGFASGDHPLTTGVVGKDSPAVANAASPPVRGTAVGITSPATAVQVSKSRTSPLTSTALTHLDGNRILYCGYDLNELVLSSTYEEVSYLLFYQALPSRDSLEAHRSRISDGRVGDQGTTKILAGVKDSALEQYYRLTVAWIQRSERDTAPATSLARHAAGLLGRFLYTLRAVCYPDQESLKSTPDELGCAEYILEGLTSQRHPTHVVRDFERMMVLYADHGTSSSTFACRMAASAAASLEDAVAVALLAFRSPLHGSASGRIAQVLLEIKHTTDARRIVSDMVKAKQRLPGFGHPLYSQGGDPRLPVMKQIARRLDSYARTNYCELAEEIERVAGTFGLPGANITLYQACALLALGVPPNLIVMSTVASRIVGWLAHVLEEQPGAVMIRPIPEYVGSPARPYVALEYR